MPVIESSARESFELEGNFMKGLAVARDGVSELELWEARMAPGASTPPHSHDAEEVVIVVAGQLIAEVGGDETVARAGDCVVVPAGALHQLHNRGDKECHTIATFGHTGVRTFLPDGEELMAPWQR